MQPPTPLIKVQVRLIRIGTELTPTLGRQQRHSCGDVRDSARGGDMYSSDVVRPRVHGRDCVAAHLDGHLHCSRGQTRERIGGAYAVLWQPPPNLAHAHVIGIPTFRLRGVTAARSEARAVTSASLRKGGVY